VNSDTKIYSSTVLGLRNGILMQGHAYVGQRCAIQCGAANLCCFVSFSTRSTLLQTERVSASEKDERLQQQRYQRMTPLLQNNTQRTIIS
jgi:hypothetical protein